ncbi:sperm flagellar protein 1 isoform X2 [Pristis pectinata]|uniref:sperm flagellar protein 1 isoform X2 n=1 Tax=Pristis pectinata TaxID=685728 RepID=UPI00223D3D2F|nr:sperm flagellar protein 1 isoform X2 [Pristis pectinata]
MVEAEGFGGAPRPRALTMKLSQDALQELYAWIDRVPLSRPKRNIARDFSDGVMVAEVVKHFLPRLVEMHNYIPANSTQQKLSNWQLLNRQIFSKLHFHISEEMLKKLVKSSPGIIEPVLYTLRQKIEEELNGIQQDAEDYSHRNDKSLPDYISVSMHPFAKECQPKPEMWNNNQRSFCEQYSHLDPAIHLLLEEKEQALLALHETVEILQMKVQRLEHLVQLKDLRIDDLTRHLKKQKAKEIAN